MFGPFEKKAVPPGNGLFLVVVRVGRGANSDMPAALTGALVPVFVAAETHELAAKSAASNLVSQGFEFLEIRGPIQQLDPHRWSDYVRQTWPEFEVHFPAQAEVLAGVAEGAIFFGPFAGYERA